MKKALFVAGLDFAIGDDDLKEIFSPYGDVESAKVIVDRLSGRSRGFGFVEMSTSDAAQACIKNLDNTPVKGRTIAVKLKEDRPSGSSNNNRGGFSRNY